MDLKAQMGQFLAPEFSLAQLAERLYQAETDPDRVVMRQWIYGEEETCRELSRAQVNKRIKVVAARLQQVADPGTRVAILAGNSPEYVFGFLGALYAGMVPIPLYDPNEPGHADHLEAVFGDCEPPIVVTNRVSAAAVRKYFSAQRERPRIISLDAFLIPWLVLGHPWREARRTPLSCSTRLGPLGPRPAWSSPTERLSPMLRRSSKHCNCRCRLASSPGCQCTTIWASFWPYSLPFWAWTSR